MEDSVIVVKISHKDTYILDETFKPLRKNDFNDLITALKDAQKKTNDCLTRLTKDTGEETVSTEDKFDDLLEDDDDDDDDSEEDSCCIVEAENDISSPKRVKLKN